MAELAKLGSAVVGRIVRMTEYPAPVTVDGDADAPYYRPLGLDGEPKVFLKAKPKTDLDKCIHCGVCASLCPMGSINPDDVTEVVGVCTNATPACATADGCEVFRRSRVPLAPRDARTRLHAQSGGQDLHGVRKYIKRLCLGIPNGAFFIPE